MSSVQQLSDEKVPAVNHLITTMFYPKGPNKGKYFIIIYQQQSRSKALPSMGLASD
ncbi:hypothetical protein C1645_838005 [Glomus cerebriforme]|uniref:Uncharacterized protein n=1 Tax=Glomus cerebriforme TaxID=658196 RepID=A0A397S5Q1_9GLOM|nr:hypothetical protein C1645_838005 [Glomus cerebriforme]